MIRRLQRSTRTDTRFPESTLFRSAPRHILFRATPHIEEHDMTQKPGGNAPMPPSAAPSPRPPLQSLPLPRYRGSGLVRFMLMLGGPSVILRAILGGAQIPAPEAYQLAKLVGPAIGQGETGRTTGRERR